MPFELHRYIIGQKGSGIRKMMEDFEVCCRCPYRNEGALMFYWIFDLASLSLSRLIFKCLLLSSSLIKSPSPAWPVFSTAPKRASWSASKSCRLSRRIGLVFSGVLKCINCGTWCVLRLNSLVYMVSLFLC